MKADYAPEIELLSLDYRQQDSIVIETDDCVPPERRTVPVAYFCIGIAVLTRSRSGPLSL